MYRFRVNWVGCAVLTARVMRRRVSAGAGLWRVSRRCAARVRAINGAKGYGIAGSGAGWRERGDAGTDAPDPQDLSGVGSGGELVGAERLGGGVACGVLVGGACGCGRDARGADDADGAVDGLAEDGACCGMGLDGKAGGGSRCDGEKDEEREESGAPEGGVDTASGVANLEGVGSGAWHRVVVIVSARVGLEATEWTEVRG